MFVDRIVLDFIAGKGGNGVVSWRREKFIPKGGPNGGNGGKGGSIYLVADAQIFSLDDFRNKRIIKAENGVQGGANLCQGRNGKDLYVKVPCGTLVKDESGEIIADLTKDKETFLLCKGGKGGRGNESFKTPTNRAPNYCTPGKEGEVKSVELELKLIADVGLIGFPNAGKSTLISALTHIKVKIAAYPFTTLRPNLGFFTLDDYSRVFIADIPGIIEGAHLDRGLGLEFLKHIERTLLLIFVLDASGIDGRNPLDDWKTLRKEIKSYNKEILEKPFLVVLNKIDDPQAEENIKAFKKGFKEKKSLLYQISAKEGEGLPDLLQAIGQEVQKIREMSKSESLT